jgi:hypothetical protein
MGSMGKFAAGVVVGAILGGALAAAEVDGFDLRGRRD